MKTLSKSELVKQNAELKSALDVREEYLTHAFRSEVTFIQKGNSRLGICGETRAHGGVVLEAARDEETRKWYVVGVHYWEARNATIAAHPFRHDDKEGLDLRTCYNQAARHVAEAQAKFYAPKIAEVCGIVS
jgi:hypothetical protein